MTSPTGDVVVCDASPLIVLARVQQLELLKRLFVNVYAPPAVWSEATADALAPGAGALLGASWIRVRAPGAVPVSRLGLGEREAMGLAAELSALLVVDDGAALCGRSDSRADACGWSPGQRGAGERPAGGRWGVNG